MPEPFDYQRANRASFLDGFVAGFDASRQGFNRETADPALGPAQVANPQPPAHVQAYVMALAGHALVIAQCDHRFDDAGFCHQCEAVDAPKATMDPRRQA